MSWIKDIIDAAKAVHEARKAGETGPLCIVPEQELWEDKLWLSKRDYENRLMQRCVVGTTMGGGDGSICRYCEEHAEGECDKDAHMKKGCTEWWLRFLTEEECKSCEQRTKAAFGFKDREDEPDDSGAAEERTDAEGPGQSVPAGDSEGV